MDFRASLTSQRGSALIFAVGLCTLVVILATSMILALHHDMRRFEHLNDTVAELAATRGSVAWAMSVLVNQEIKNKTEKVYGMDMNGVQVHASIIDLDGLFNINTLLETENNADTNPPTKTDSEFTAVEIFKRLTDALNVSHSMVTSMRSKGMPLVYLSQMKSEFELPQAMYEVLLPYVRANAETEQSMNVNTMPPVLLAALLAVEEPTAKAILARGPFESEAEFSEALSQLSIQISSAELSKWLKYDSQQYLVHTQIKAKGVTDMYTLLAPVEKGWRVVYQSTGVRL